MNKKLLGIIALLVGIALAFYGNHLNNSLEAQLSSLFNSGSINPGNVWLYGGIALAVIGGILLILGIAKNNEST